MKTEHRDISRRTGTVGFFTLLSRILGLARDVVIASVFGASRMADAFYVAFRIPNVLRRLVGEGALTVAFIPVYTEYLKTSRAAGRRALSVVFTFLVIALLVIVAGGIIFAPWVVRLIAHGFESLPDKFSLTVLLTRIMFPYIFFISLVALAMGVLNACKQFAAPAASPILLNLAIIFGALVLGRCFAIPTVGLALSVLIGGVLQLLLQWRPLQREGMLPRLDFDWRHPALSRLGLMMIPAAYGAAVYQLNILIVTLLASYLPEGSVSYLWFADRVSEFPQGVFALSVAAATLPTLSDHVVDREQDAFRDTMNFSLRLNLLISIPSAVGLWLLSLPIIRVLFQRGLFGDAAVVATAGALNYFALKLPLVASVQTLVPAFFARRESRIPVMASTVAVVSNAIAAYLLMGPMLHMGLALATTISSGMNLIVLLWYFERRVGRLGNGKLWGSLLRTLLASGIMGAAIVAAVRAGHLFAAASRWQNAAELLVLIACAVFFYLGLIRIMSPDEYRALVHMLRRRTAITAATNVEE